MSAKQSKNFWPVILAYTITMTGIYFASARTPAVFSPVNKFKATINRQPEQKAESVEGQTAGEYVERGRIRPQLHAVLDVLGDRLEKPGKERLTLTGTMTKAGSQQSISVLVVREFPERLRLEEEVDGERRVTVFNGDSVRRNWNSHNRRDEDLIETLTRDSIEHFLTTQLGGAATRFLGARFRLDDGTTSNYRGPLYDLYEISEANRVGREVRRQTKIYYFNSDTHLLERVKYQIQRDGPATIVEVRLNKWQEVQGQKLPGEIVRLENDTPVLTLNINSAGVSARAADGLFGGQ
jgi:hypothetical protein